MTKRVFIGLNNIANVGLSLKSGFEELGIKADFYSNEKVRHKYDYPKDSDKYVNIIEYSRISVIRYLQVFFLIIKIIFRYKYIIFLQGSEGYLLSGMKDIKLFNMLGKKIGVIFAGCDVRLPDLVKKYKWNPCSNCPKSYQEFVGCRFPKKYNRLKALAENFNYIFSPDECSGYFDNSYFTYYFPVIDIVDRGISITEYISEQNKKIRILHAPSNEDYKGSKYIYSVIDKLRKKYDFDFIILKDLSKDKLINEIMKSDLLIDQMLVGFYGVLSVETMLLKVPVICYISEDIWPKIKNDSPIYNANPDNLEEVLMKILKNPSQLLERGKRSREYVLQYHSPQKIALNMMEVMDKN